MIPAPELSRRVAAADIADRPVSVEIAASAAERRALARRFDLVAIDRLTGRSRLSRSPARDGSGPVIRVDMAFEADVTQRCVVTLEPAPARCAESGLTVEFSLAPGPAPAAADVPAAGIDPPEPLAGDVVDVGELLAQHFALALDPWPRAPGAALAETSGEAPPPGPFAALAGWRGGRSGGGG